MAARRKRVSFTAGGRRVSFLAGGERAPEEGGAYRGYLVKRTLQGYGVEKGGAWIGGPYPTAAEARRVIDVVIG